MDQRTDNRKYRLEYVANGKDTDRQWSLINAAIEEANIKFHNLESTQATKMRGRSKATYQTCDRGLLN